jgi:endonuclease/exonuclease/phosphatase family metal-dependent hydrolase
MTWNIHGGVGPDGRRDLDRVTALVRRHDPDMDSRSGRGAANFAFEMLASALGAHAAEAKCLLAPDGDYGHVIISRWPLGAPTHRDISVGGREPRAAIEVTSTHPLANYMWSLPILD